MFHQTTSAAASSACMGNPKADKQWKSLGVFWIFPPTGGPLSLSGQFKNPRDLPRFFLSQDSPCGFSTVCPKLKVGYVIEKFL